jgi:hypothetical protein
MADRVQIKRDTLTNWLYYDPILAQGELGLDLDSNNIKIGDGISKWTELSYVLNTLSDVFYSFDQLTPSDNWTITHGLNKFPSVTIVDSSGNIVIGDVRYISYNELEVSFSAGFSGKAYLN